MTFRWPHVVDEFESMRRVAQGMSLARYGDGELNLCLGRDIKCQTHSRRLQDRLRSILLGSGPCAVGVPNVMAKTKPYWEKFKTERYARLFDPERVYLSAFVSRPDSAPWIHVDAYWRIVADLWVGQDVTLVRGSEKSLTPDELHGAANVREVRCLRQNAFQEYDRLLDRVGTPKRAILCCGPTATVLAVDLAARGVHAVDLGHVGMWTRRLHLSPEEALAEGRREP